MLTLLILLLPMLTIEQQSSITILGRICSPDPVTISNDYIQNLMNSMDPYISSCSYGKMRMPLPLNIVVGPIDIPCKGFITVQNIPWSGQTCNDIDYLGWITYARTIFNATNYSHTILVMFGNVTLQCPWSGLSVVDCGLPGTGKSNTCNIWLQSLGLDNIYYEQQSTVLHELGHNWGLMHSSTPGSEYGDFSCAMASCCGQRCFNVYQSRKMGWSLPIESIVEPLKGHWFSYNIPGLLLTDTNHITIDLSASIDKGLYFVSFRVPYGYDVNLLPYLQNMVYVHYVPSKNIQALQKPVLYAMLSQDITNNTFVQKNVISIKVEYIVQGVSAYVSFCVPMSPPLPIFNTCGLDINCDGHIQPCALPITNTNTCTCCCGSPL